MFLSLLSNLYFRLNRNVTSLWLKVATKRTSFSRVLFHLPSTASTCLQLASVSASSLKHTPNQSKFLFRLQGASWGCCEATFLNATSRLRLRRKVTLTTSYLTHFSMATVKTSSTSPLALSGCPSVTTTSKHCDRLLLVTMTTTTEVTKPAQCC